MCYFSDPDIEKRKPMPLGLYKKIAGDIFSKIRVLYLSCAAEPFMTKNFIEFIRIAKQYNVPTISFCTNGTLLNEEKIRDIVDLGVNEVIISLDGATANTYEKIRRGAQFDKVIENIDLFRKIKQEKNRAYPNIRLNYLLMRSTIDEIEPFFDLIKDKDIASVNFREMLYFHTEDPDHFSKESILDDQQLYEKIIASIDKKAKETGIDVVTSIGCQKQVNECRYRRFECLFPWFAMWIDSVGKFKPCAFYGYAGDLSQESYWDVRKGREFKKIRRDLFFRPKKSCLNTCITKQDAI
jgi:MoaA/NifB/PqqE/SkfB family radical SAM enzyme